MDKNVILKIKELSNEGASDYKISQLLNVTRSQARYYRLFYNDNKIKEEIEEESKICEIIKSANSIYQVCKILGVADTNEYYNKIKKIIQKYNISTEHFGTKKIIKKNKKINLSDILQENVSYSSTKLLHRLIKSNLKEHKCECCGNTEWNGKPIPIELVIIMIID